jgi:ribonuclease HII
MYEQQLWQQHFSAIAGVDEAGRGPLAGPVVAAAVIFPQHHSTIPGINDSKQLSEKKRDFLFDVVCQHAVSFGIGVVDHHEIDHLNILQATYKAMSIAVENCHIPPDYVLVDGRGLPRLAMPAQAIIKGDAKSLSIAAASILAKVTRDRLMVELHGHYPEYGFQQHKGYPTKKHIQAIRKHGLSPVHRRSFRPKQLEDMYADR